MGLPTFSSRFVAGAPSAVLITCVLFVFMHHLVANPSKPEEAKPSIKIDISREKRNESVQREDRTRPERPETLEAPPPPPTATRLAERAQVDGLDVVMPDFSNSADFAAQGDGGVSAGAMNLKPQIKIPPQYPMRAAQRRIEGTVVVCFDITAQGDPVKIEVVEATPPGYFERAVTQAVARWKYAPLLVDGQPRPRQDVCDRLNFELDSPGAQSTAGQAGASGLD